MPFSLPFDFSIWYVISVAIQIFFIVHAVRSGRAWWAIPIFFFPFLGSAIYFFLEYLPELRARRGLGRATKTLVKKLNPGAEIRRLEEQAAYAGTVTNRLALAGAYLEAGRTEDAIRTYESCAGPIHGDDPRVLSELSRAYFEGGRFAEARATFEKLRGLTVLTPDQRLLGARIAEAAGETEAALEEYGVLARMGSGAEPRYRYGQLLARLGRDEEAAAAYDDILRHARLSPRHYRAAQKEWIDLAKKALKERESAGR